MQNREIKGVTPRKKRVITALLALILLALTGCGTAADGGNTSSESKAASDGSAAGGEDVSDVLKDEEAKADVAQADKAGTSAARTDKDETSDTRSDTTGTDKDDTLSIVTTIFPQYDWVRQIMGKEAFDAADVTLLTENGVDLHSYEPSVKDMVKISDCDMLIYVGGASDAWVDDALKNANNKNMVVINLMDVLGDGAKEEELVEGMEDDADDAEKVDEKQPDADEQDSDGKQSDADEQDSDGKQPDADEQDSDGKQSDTDKSEAEKHTEDLEMDEHVWLSLRNAEIFVRAIEGGLAKLSPDRAGTFLKNADTYIGKLTDLDHSFTTAVSKVKDPTLIFGDRFPFRYLVDDYKIRYYAAFVGCSAETEASFDTLIFLADKVNTLGIDSVCTIETSDKKLAGSIIRNTKDKDQDIVTLNSMQKVTKKDIDAGKTYLSLMKENFEKIEKAL